MRLLLRQLVVAAFTAGEVADVEQPSSVPKLDALGVVNAFSMGALASLFRGSSGPTRMLSQKEGTGLSGRLALFCE